MINNSDKVFNKLSSLEKSKWTSLKKVNGCSHYEVLNINKRTDKIELFAICQRDKRAVVTKDDLKNKLLWKRGWESKLSDDVLTRNKLKNKSIVREKIRNKGSKKINFIQKLEKFQGYWSPRVVDEMNDYQVKLAKILGEFVWHKHDTTDELFYVIEGEMKIVLKDGAINLSKGEMYIVPKGVYHKPIAEKECHIMLIEPRGIVNTGEKNNTLTAKLDDWI